MKIQRTVVIETDGGVRVELLIADAPDADAAQSSISILAPITGEDRYPRLPELQQAALRHARTAIDREIHRLEQARGHTA